MFRSRRKHAALEASLRANRAEPRPEFVAAIVDRVGVRLRNGAPGRSGSRSPVVSPLHCSSLSRRSAASAMQLRARRAQSDPSARAPAPSMPARTVAESAAKPVRGQDHDLPSHQVREQPDGDDHHQRQRFAGAPAAWGHDRAVPGRRYCWTGVHGGGGRGTAVSWATQSLPFTGFTIAFAFFAAFALISGGAAHAPLGAREVGNPKASPNDGRLGRPSSFRAALAAYAEVGRHDW